MIKLFVTRPEAIDKRAFGQVSRRAYKCPTDADGYPLAGSICSPYLRRGGNHHSAEVTEDILQ